LPSTIRLQEYMVRPTFVSNKTEIITVVRAEMHNYVFCQYSALLTLKASCIRK
jgi:hypothetical protein